MPIFKLLFGLKSASTSMYYLYRKHSYEQLLFNRFKELYENGAKSSGIYVVERQRFGGLFWYIQSLIPFNQSLVITDKKTGTRRHVGLGKIPSGSKSFLGTYGWVNYSPDQSINLSGREIPIEAWPDYYLKYGKWPDPEKIDHELLNEITRTHDDQNPSKIPLFIMEYGQRFDGCTGTKEFGTDKSAILNAIRMEEKKRYF